MAGQRTTSVSPVGVNPCTPEMISSFVERNPLKFLGRAGVCKMMRAGRRGEEVAGIVTAFTSRRE
jgi:hypothetical protein